MSACCPQRCPFGCWWSGTLLAVGGGYGGTDDGRASLVTDGAGVSFAELDARGAGPKRMVSPA